MERVWNQFRRELRRAPQSTTIEQLRAAVDAVCQEAAVMIIVPGRTTLLSNK